MLSAFSHPMDVLPIGGGPAACQAKVNKEARLVKRKICFISHAGNWQGGQTEVTGYGSENYLQPLGRN